MSIVFLHPPGIYDFRKHPAFLGPISEAVPSTPLFEMYPMGFVSMAAYLEKHGFRARIVNLALKMLNSEKFDAEEYIRKLDSEMFCIDLHWIAHLHGAVEVAKICKKFHPGVPVVFGGFTSTYYDKEILSKFSQVDYVIKGDSCEVPLLDLAENLNNKNKDEIRNLSYREGSAVKSNPISFVPESFGFVIDPKFMVKLILRDMDLDAVLPYKSWLEEPTMPILTSKGCLFNCVNCGGSKDCYLRMYGRNMPAFMDPDKVVEQMALNEKYIRNPVFFLNDIRMGGKKYYRNVFEKIKKEKIDLPVVFELFSPLTEEYAQDLKNTFAHFNLEMSPEDANESVRYNIGKNYSNSDVEESIKTALKYGCDKIDLFFMIGLGKQTKEDVQKTLEYIDLTLKKFKGREKAGANKIYPFISPYAPTLDPGCIAFEDPEKYGYIVFYRTLEEQYDAFKKTSWKQFFNYRTHDLTPDDIVNLTYESALKLAEIKNRHGIITDQENEKVKKQVRASKKIMEKIDIIARMKDDEQDQAVSALKQEISETMKPIIHKNKELNWPRSRRSINIHALRIIGKIMRML